VLNGTPHAAKRRRTDRLRAIQLHTFGVPVRSTAPRQRYTDPLLQDELSDGDFTEVILPRLKGPAEPTAFLIPYLPCLDE